MINEYLLQFAEWLDSQAASQMLVSSYYAWSWVESIHVLTLMVCIGCLFIIDFRMLGWMMSDVPAVEVARRLHYPMITAFALMFITGALLVYAEPVASVQSIWFRLKMILLILAGINAWVFNHKLSLAADESSNDFIATPAMRWGASISLFLWCSIIILGRFIAYDWVDCSNTENTTILWAAGCVNELQNFN